LIAQVGGALAGQTIATLGNFPRINRAGDVAFYAVLSDGTRVIAMVPNGANARRVSGRMRLLSFDGDARGVSAKIVLHNTSTNVRTEYPVTLVSNGWYSVELPTSGTYQVYLKASHWLSKLVSTGPFDFASDSLPLMNADLPNGDVDADDAISILDYLALSVAYGSSTGGSGWNAAADLDGDGEVSILDYITLSQNFDLEGNLLN
jgi:hypothetical protein